MSKVLRAANKVNFTEICKIFHEIDGIFYIFSVKSTTTILFM